MTEKQYVKSLKAYLRYAAKTMEDKDDLAAIVRDLDRKLDRWDREVKSS